jgi:hypothetical protein
MDRAVDTTAPAHGAVCSVDDRVHVLVRNVAKNGGDDRHAAQYAYECRLPSAGGPCMISGAPAQ